MARGGPEEDSAAFQKEWVLGEEELDLRIAERAPKNGDEPRLLESIIQRKSRCVVLPREALGADLVFVLWCGDERLTVYVQAKSGKASTPAALLSLTQPYATNRGEAGTVPQSLQPALQAMKDLERGGRVVHVVIKVHGLWK